MKQGQQDAAGAGTEIEQPPGMIAPFVGINPFQRPFDQTLRIRPGRESVAADREGQAPELAHAGDLADRLAPTAACNRFLETHLRLRRHQTFAMSDQINLFDTGGPLQQDARIKARVGHPGIGEDPPAPLAQTRQGAVMLNVSLTSAGHGHRSCHLGQLRRLILGDQGIYDLVERFTGNDLVELVKSKPDTVIRHPALREIVGADSL